MNASSGQTATPVERMYLAGKVAIPDVAATVSGAVQSLRLASQTVNVQTALAGDPKGMRDTLELCEELHAALRSLTESLNNCATAVIDAAEDFAGTDERAGRDLSRLDPELRSDEPAPAFEVSEIDDLSAPGATTVSAPDNSPTKTHETHIDSTPAPDYVPTVDRSRHGRDARIDDVQPPGEVS